MGKQGSAAPPQRFLGAYGDWRALAPCPLNNAWNPGFLFSLHRVNIGIRHSVQVSTSNYLVSSLFSRLAGRQFWQFSRACSALGPPPEKEEFRLFPLVISH